MTNIEDQLHKEVKRYHISLADRVICKQCGLRTTSHKSDTCLECRSVKKFTCTICGKPSTKRGICVLCKHLKIVKDARACND